MWFPMKVFSFAQRFLIWLPWIVYFSAAEPLDVLLLNDATAILWAYDDLMH